MWLVVVIWKPSMVDSINAGIYIYIISIDYDIFRYTLVLIWF